MKPYKVEITPDRGQFIVWHFYNAPWFEGYSDSFPTIEEATRFADYIKTHHAEPMKMR